MVVSGAAQCLLDHLDAAEMRGIRRGRRPSGASASMRKCGWSKLKPRRRSHPTPRELDCLRLRVEGFSYQEIAQVLGVRPGTVGALLPRVYSKLRDAAAEGIVLSEGTASAMLLRGGQTYSP